MAKFNAAALVLAMALMCTLMAAAQVGAVDITAFTSKTACAGTIIKKFPSFGDGQCAPLATKAGSVLFNGLTACKEGIVYSGANCANVVSRKNGPPGSVCFIGGGFASAKWRTIPGCV